MTPDTSVLVPALSTWHRQHEIARRAVRGLTALVAHAELEAYSVLTRMPAPNDIDAATAALALQRAFPGPRHVLAAGTRRRVVRQLAAHGITGGAVYDALIALTAAEHDLPLLTLDRRAVGVYERLGVDYRLLG